MQIELSSDERGMLLGLVESAIKETRVEVRRTSTPNVHDDLIKEKLALQSLLEKLRGAA